MRIFGIHVSGVRVHEREYDPKKDKGLEKMGDLVGRGYTGEEARINLENLAKGAGASAAFGLKYGHLVGYTATATAYRKESKK